MSSCKAEISTSVYSYSGYFNYVFAIFFLAHVVPSSWNALPTELHSMAPSYNPGFSLNSTSLERTSLICLRTNASPPLMPLALS